MKNKSFLLIFLLVLLFASCGSPSSTKPAKEEYNDTSPKIEKTPSIIGKWYYNSEDDRYYFNFLANGNCYYQYTKTGTTQQNLNNDSFISMSGTWSYINEEKTKFTVGWKGGSIDSWYNIISEDDEKLVVARDPNYSYGDGLFGFTELLKTAKTVIYTVPEEIELLMGTWYYDSTKDGRYLTFRNDKVCYYHYYQTGMLEGWVTTSGTWGYSTQTKILAITIKGEITYYYDIDTLTFTTLVLSMSENNPSYQSMILPTSQLYK